MKNPAVKNPARRSGLKRGVEKPDGMCATFFNTIGEAQKLFQPQRFA